MSAEPVGPDPSRVSIARAVPAAYPASAPFDPPESYPEMAAAGAARDPGNGVYRAVREAFLLLGLDAAHAGGADWNPLGDLVRPGDSVLIKPNLVRHFHGDGTGTEALVTHGSVVRAVMDYAALALKGRGRITLGDAPLQYADFAATLASSGVDRVLDSARKWAGVPIEAVDFRRERSEKRGGLIVARLANAGDPGGYHVVRLDGRSRFAGLPERRAARYRVTQYDPATMRSAHGAGHHAYVVPDSVLAADVVLNLPKLKTHRKAGLTAAMKNLVGINGSKDWLPHHTAGSAEEGGDEYARRSLRKRIISDLRDRIEAAPGAGRRRALRAVEQAVKATGRLVPFPDPHWEGSWHGNDTLWRMVHDLHTVLFFADRQGRLHDHPQRRYLAVVDAIIAGEGEGPMRPSPRAAGLIVAGSGPAAVDAACCRLMGFDEAKVPLLAHASEAPFHPRLPAAGGLAIASTDGSLRDLFSRRLEATLRFVPPAGWAGAVELDR